MTLFKDPEQNERKFIRRFAELPAPGRRMLEVGCGEGRLTWLYADASHFTLGLDSDQDAVHIASADRPHKLSTKIHFACAKAEHLPLRNDSFDMAVFAWSL